MLTEAAYRVASVEEVLVDSLHLDLEPYFVFSGIVLPYIKVQFPPTHVPAILDTLAMTIVYTFRYSNNIQYVPCQL